MAGTLAPYRTSLAGTLLAARESVMAPIRPILREAGVTDQQWRVLRVLADEGGMDPSRLAQAALLHLPSLTRILKDMVDRRLVERRIDPNDRRRSIVALLPDGAALVDRTAVHTLALLEEYGSRFGRDRLESLRKNLSDLIEALVGVETHAATDGGRPNPRDIPSLSRDDGSARP